MSKRIGIVGAGTAGLHLGLYLRQHGVDTTIFTNRRPEEYERMRLANTVAHHAVTIDREEALGVNHWPTDEYGYFGHHYCIGPQPPLRFYGSVEKPSRAVDYRIYLPALMNDFTQRGGVIEYRTLAEDDVSAVSDEFDLIVVCAGGGALGGLFERVAEHSPFGRPQRAICAGLFKGIRQRPHRAGTLYISPGAGEMIEFPTLSFGGVVNALVIENIPGGELETLATTRYDDDPGGFIELLLAKMREHYPDCVERIDESEFELANGPLDIIQGGVVPVVRETSTTLPNGKIALALGDVQSILDPVLGQGANMASFAAWVVGEQIVAQDVYDARFVEHVDNRRQDRVLAATRWTNLMLEKLNTLSPDLQQFIGRVSQDQALADRFTDNFNYPERQWDCFASPARTEAWCANPR